jgi:hypothetical protein
MGQRATTDELFNDAYSTQGMQPSVGDRKIRNVEVTAKNSIVNAEGRETGRVSNRVSKRVSRAERREMNNITPTQSPAKNSGQVRNAQAANEPNYSQDNKIDRSLNYRRRQAQLMQAKKGKKDGGSATGAVKSIKDRRKAISITARIAGPLVTLYTFILLPLSLLSMLFLGMRIAFDYAMSDIETNPDDGFFTSATNETLNLFLDGVKGASELASTVSEYLFDFDITALLDPTTFFLVTYTLVLIISMIQLLLVYLLYKLSLLEPLGGKGSGLKFNMLILAVIGYSFPLLNLVPWVAFWLLAIIKNPK